MIKLSDLPYEQFEMLGVTKRDLLHLPPRTLNALLNGQRTSLLRFNNIHLPGLNGPNSIDTKLSIELKTDGKAILKVHPINKTAKNTFNLSQEEITSLQKDSTNYVDRSIKLIDGSFRNVMIYLDKMTNEFIAINKDTIKAPEQINNTALTDQQKEDFRNGKPVTINGESFRINPNAEIGISSMDGNDLKISNIRFKHSSYSNKELAFDLVLLGSGTDNIVLLEHWANIALYTAPDSITLNDSFENLNNSSYWDTIYNASKEIRGLDEEAKYNISKIAEIVNRHLGKLGVIYSIDRAPAENLAAEDGNRTAEYTTKKAS